MISVYFRQYYNSVIDQFPQFMIKENLKQALSRKYVKVAVTEFQKFNEKDFQNELNKID